MDSLISKIKFFSDNASFEVISDSNSVSILRKVKDNNTYFLKIIKSDHININKIKKAIEIYKENDINTIELLDYGYINDYVYLIYNFIEGHALNTIYDKYSVSDYRKMGLKIGNSYRIINSTNKYDKFFLNNYDISNLTNQVIYLFEKLYNGELSYIKDIMKEEKINCMIKRMKELVSSFDDEKKVYIHSDIHPKNIVVDNEDNLYIIDIESFSLDYFIMNMRWSIMAAFKNKKNNEFFKGFINGYYNNDIPPRFNKQLIFITILNFMEHTIEFSKIKNKEFIISYVSRINLIFNSIDLFIDNNILSNIKKFEEE